MKIFFKITIVLLLLGLGLFSYTMLAYNWTDKITLLSYGFEPGTNIEIKWQDGSTEYLNYIYAGDETIELRSRPNSLIKNWVETTSGEIIFDAEYEIDELGRRKSLNPEQAQKHAVFFGCSDLFGMGVPIQDTIPSLFADQAEDYKVYNYGYVGASPAYFLRLLEINNFSQEISEPAGKVFYVMTEGHYPKSVGKFGHMHQPEMPIYELIDGEPIFQGTYEEVRPWMTRFKRHAAGSLLNRIIDPNAWTFYSTKENELICSIIGKTKKEFTRNFPNSMLIYFLHENMRDVDRKLMKDCLVKQQVDFIDAHLDFYDESFETSSIDRHPTRAVNYLMVKKMVKFIQGND